MYEAIKYVCPNWIRPAETLRSHPKKNFKINGHWYSKFNTQQSLIKIISVVQIIWRIFKIKLRNQLMWTSMNIQIPPSSQPSTSLQGKHIRRPDLKIPHKQFANTLQEKFQDKWLLIQLMWTSSSKINDAMIKTKPSQNNTSRWNILRKLNCTGNLLKDFLIFDHMTNII